MQGIVIAIALLGLVINIVQKSQSASKKKQANQRRNPFEPTQPESATKGEVLKADDPFDEWKKMRELLKELNQQEATKSTEIYEQAEEPAFSYEDENIVENEQITIEEYATDSNEEISTTSGLVTIEELAALKENEIVDIEDTNPEFDLKNAILSSIILERKYN